jgi:hypothetical protein
MEELECAYNLISIRSKKVYDYRNNYFPVLVCSLFEGKNIILYYLLCIFTGLAMSMNHFLQKTAFENFFLLPFSIIIMYFICGIWRNIHLNSKVYYRWYNTNITKIDHEISYILTKHCHKYIGTMLYNTILINMCTVLIDFVEMYNNNEKHKNHEYLLYIEETINFWYLTRRTHLLNNSSSNH